MADQYTQTLGTVFTGDIKDVKIKVEALKKLLADFKGHNRDQFKKAASDVDQYTKGVRAAGKAVEDFGKKAQRAHGKQISHIQAFKDQVKSAFRVSAAYGIAGTTIYTFINSLRVGTREIMDFDQSLKNLEAITGATPSQIRAMSDEILNVSRTTKFSTKEVADGMVLLGQAGFSAEESVQAIQATANLATGTLSDMRLTTDLLTTAIRAFNLEAVDSNRVSDVMANAINKSKLTIDKLRIAFNYVGASASAVGLSIEETAATFMILANHGLRASTIGTGMRQVLARLMAPGKKLREIFNEYGIELDSVNPKTQGFQQSIKNMIPVLWDYENKTIDMTKAYELFGLRGAQAAAVLIRAFTSSDYKNILAQTYEVGAAQKMMETQAKGLAVKFKNLGDRLKNIAIALGDAGVTGAMRGFLTVLQSVAGAIEWLLMNPIGQAIVQFSALTPIIFGLGKALVFLEGVIVAKLIPAVKAMNLAFLKSPWFWVPAAIAAVILAYRRLVTMQDRGIKKIEDENSKRLQSIASLESYGGAIQSLMQKVKEGNATEEEHRALIERLKKDHPDLAGAIDATTQSYEGLEQILGMVNDRLRERQIDSMISNIDKINKLKDKILSDAIATNAKAAGMYGVPVMLPTTVISDEDVKKQEENSQEIQNTYAEIAQSIFWMSKAADEPMVKAGEIIQQITADGKHAIKIYSMVQKRINEFNDAEAAIPEQWKKKLKEIPAFMKDVYDSLSPGKQVDFMLGLDTLDKQIDKYKRIARAQGQTVEEINAGVREKQEDWLQKFYDKTIRDEEKTARKILDIKIEAEKAALAEKNNLAIKSIQNRETLALVEKKNRIEFLEWLADQEKAYVQSVVDEHGEGSVEALNAEMKYQQAITELREAETDLSKTEAEKRIADRINELKAKLKLEKEYSAEWKAIREELKALGETVNAKDEDAQREYEARQGSWLDQFKFGVKKAKKEAGTLADTFIYIGENIYDTFATNLVDALGKGGEAMEDFAKDMINWISKIILKAVIMNSLMGMGGPIGELFGGGGGGSATAVASVPNVQTYYLHKGGIVGVDGIKRAVTAGLFAFAPRFHQGLNLKANEFPAILERGETVIPKDQSSQSDPQIVKYDHNYFIMAADAKSFSDMCKRNPGAIAGVIGKQMRYNTATRKNFRSNL